MTERHIHLDLSLPQSGARSLQAGTDDTGRDAARGAVDPQARKRFERTMAAGPTSPNSNGPAPAVPPPPFALFGAAASVPVAAQPVAPADATLTQQLGHAIERLMVDDDHRGNRQVRMDLKNDVLPGVSVVVQQGEGRLQVDFICSVESSRLRLIQAAPVHAQTLAQRLDRDVLLRVSTNDDEDPCLFEVGANP